MLDFFFAIVGLGIDLFFYVLYLCFRDDSSIIRIEGS